MKIKISKGNSKLGNIYNFNITPVKSCSAEARKTCAVNGCYALKSYRQYPAVKNAWDINYNIVKNSPLQFYDEMVEYLTKHEQKIKYFRIHSAGDFVDSTYLLAWIMITRKFPNIRFLAYTKQFAILRDILDYKYVTHHLEIPSNFTIYLSAWENLEIPTDLQEIFPTAYIANKGDFIKSFECPTSCKDCKYCYNSNNDVTFIKH